MWLVVIRLDSAGLDFPFGIPKLSPFLLYNNLAVFKLLQKYVASPSVTLFDPPVIRMFPPNNKRL